MSRVRPWARGFLLMPLLAVMLLFAPRAQAVQITGIADENLEEWGGATWSAFNATGIKQVRHIIPWDTAYRPAALQEAAAWINTAESHGLRVMISFGHNEQLAPAPHEYLHAVAAFRALFPQVKDYTAWNEPNHRPDGYPEAKPAAHVAAGYWVNLNFLCTHPHFGPPCTVAAGDFLDPNQSGEDLEKYIEKYKETLAEAGVSPSVWAIHPYKAAETNDWEKIEKYFLPHTEGKPIWFTEVGGLVCRKNKGYSQNNLAESLALQQQSVINLMNKAMPAVQRTYYYAMSARHDGGFACEPGNYQEDPALLHGGVPRPAYYTLFPWTQGGGGGGTPTYDFSGDGKSDIIARKPDGSLWMYRGNGAGGWATGNGEWIGAGFQVFDAVRMTVDFSGDGTTDLIARKPDGSLWMFRGNGAGGWITGNPEWIGAGWNMFDALVTPADFSGDGKSDIIARKPDGSLWMYRGNGAGGWITGNPEWIGAGFEVFDAFVEAYDFSGDGKTDLIARKPDGSLWMLRGNGAGGWITGNPEWIGAGWNAFTFIVGSLDFSGDGKVDLIARTADGNLWLYRGNGAGGWVTGNAEWIGADWHMFDVIRAAS